MSCDLSPKSSRGAQSAAQADVARQSFAEATANIFQLGVVIGRSTVTVELSGEIDLAAAPKLTTLLESLDGLHMTVCIDMAAVTFIDSTGLQPIVDAARRRQQRRLPQVTIGECNFVSRRLLQITGLGPGPVLDLGGWATFWRQLD